MDKNSTKNILTSLIGDINDLAIGSLMSKQSAVDGLKHEFHKGQQLAYNHASRLIMDARNRLTRIKEITPCPHFNFCHSFNKLDTDCTIDVFNSNQCFIN